MSDFWALMIELGFGWILVAASFWAILAAAGIADDEAEQPRG